MRIKIIGDNNCARATRHLLRLAGFAVTEFLPAEVVTQAPHSGYAIAIETSSRAALPVSGQASTAQTSILRAASTAQTSSLRAASTAQTSSLRAASTAHTRLAPAPQPLTPSYALKAGATEGSPSSELDLSTHGQPAAIHGEASLAHGGVSSPAFFLEAESAGCEGGGLGDGWDAKSKQAEACSTRNIHFDSVDSELEAAILRHVTQLAAAPVMVDRPGGVVHSERELRIILPVTGDARADEAAAVAVEFGVLRGLLDLTRRPSQGELSGGTADLASQASGKSAEMRGGGRKKWWIFGVAFLGVALAVFGARLDASPRVRGAIDGKSTQAEACATGGRTSYVDRSGGLLKTRVARGAVLRSARALAAAEPQEQFATGQAVKIFDGTNTLVVDPCQAQTKLFASISQTANTQLVAGTSSKKIYICSIHVVVAAATSVALVEGTGTVCATGTAGVSGFGGATPATGWNFMANGGIALGNGEAAVGAEGTSADNLCLLNSGSGQVSGGISYVVQ